MAKDEDREEPRELKQQKIADPNRKTVPEVEAAAENYVKLRNKRMRAGDVEKEAANVLLQLMHHHKLQVYTFNGQVVTIAEVEKIKVNTLKDED